MKFSETTWKNFQTIYIKKIIFLSISYFIQTITIFLMYNDKMYTNYIIHIFQ